MEKQTDLDIGIGTKESESLEPKKVKIADVHIEPVNKDNKKVGDKVICIVQHPDKKDGPIAISSVEFIGKGKKVKNTGLWLNKDEEGLIRKGSSLAVLLNFLNVSSIRGLVDKEVDTVADDKGYLCLKAY